VTTWSGFAETTTHYVRYGALATSTATTTEYIAMSDTLCSGGSFTSMTIGGAPAVGPADCGVWDTPPHTTAPQNGSSYVLSGAYGDMTVTLGGVVRSCFVRLQSLTQAKMYCFWNTGTRAIGDVDEVTYTRTFVPAP
jgi:hypothetical protein